MPLVHRGRWYRRIPFVGGLLVLLVWAAVSSCGSNTVGAGRRTGQGQAAIGAAAQVGPSASAGHDHALPVDAGCPLPAAAFCDTFTDPYGGDGYGPKQPTGRTASLNPARWSVAHQGGTNFGQGQFFLWPGTKYAFCRDPKAGLLPPHDYFSCGPQYGESMHFMEAFDDTGGYVWNDAMGVQPLDFAGRSTSVSFDVDAKTTGGHTWWVEAWITDQPLPGPHWGFVKTLSLPRNGISIKFNGACKAGGQPGTSVGGVEFVADYRPEPLSVKAAKCFRTMDDMRNRITVKLSANHLEVWATDHEQKNDQLVAVLDNLRLPFTRGYLHLEHAQYNAAKDGNTPYQTYHWDNVAFDGPQVPPTRSYQVPDALKRGNGESVNLGYQLPAKGKAFTVDGVDLAGARRAYFSFSHYCEDFTGRCPTIRYRVNGGAVHTYELPQQIVAAGSKPLAVPIELSELHGGANTVELI